MPSRTNWSSSIRSSARLMGWKKPKRVASACRISTATCDAPSGVVLNAFNLNGEEVTMELDGLFARAVQHEIDHLDGILFIDRLSSTGLLDIKPSLITFEEQFVNQRQRGEIPSDAAIAARLAELEQLRT